YAATSAVRPPCVVEAVTRFLEDVGATPGRGGHSLALEAGRMAFRCRRSLARILGLPGDPGRIAFMQNATHALNTALWGLLRPDDLVVITAYDHNAVLRPVHRLSMERGVEVRSIPGAPDGSVDLEAAERLLEGAQLLVVNAASNVLGTRLPLSELAAKAHDAGALVLLDAAQSAGHLPGCPAEEGADLVAFTGHKGLLGPQGTGGLWIRDSLDVAPLLAGGTGGDSTLREMPPRMPDHLEAGTGNAPGLAGLLAGCEYLMEIGVETVHARVGRLKGRLRDGLEQIDGVRVLSPPAPDGVGVVTITASRVDPATLSQRLDSEWGVMTRSGLHCAPEVHRILGTAESGAVRFSLGWASTEEDVDQALRGVEAIAGRSAVATS
ncbi:MAG TPA: aminotransferase class V-fold PLP-dependent enzyme, partial [Longimicrobiales bacterium]|nr:aminotransferase class V-fold PLP-dependent enzyme [Longimicrobiales bacterium]